MEQIRSRVDLERWLEGKPRDFAQVIAARAALRMLPYAFVHDGNDSNKWMKGSGIAFFRAVALPLIAFDFPDRDMSETILRAGLHLASTGAYSHAANAILEAGMAFNSHEGMIGGKLQNIISFAVSTVVLEGQSLGSDGNSDSVWLSVSEECNALETDDDPDTAASRLRNNSVTEQLGFVGVGEWASASKRLYNLDPTYNVWLKWYDRRILGEEAAFAIPGDTGRVEDKKILIRLADATDKDFWDKGATHVNTTLQSWIDEARIEAQIQEIIRKLRGGASAHYGAQDELDKRATLLAELDRMLGKPPQGRFGIGGNSPPEPIDVPSAPVALPQDLRDPIEAISAELEKTEPDALVIAEKAALLHRAFKKLKKMASSAADKAADAFGTAVGTAAGVGLVSYVGLSVTGILPKILDWLAPLIH